MQNVEDDVLFSIQITCSLCSEIVEREARALHNYEQCPKRMVSCKYCELPLPAVDIVEHEVPHQIFCRIFFFSGQMIVRSAELC